MRVDPRERECRDTANLLGFALLLFSGAFLLFSLVMSLLPLGLDALPARAADILYQALHGVLYTAVFLLPIWFFYKMRTGERPPVPMRFEPCLWGRALPHLLAGLAAIHLAAQINARLVELMGISTPVTVGPTVGEDYGLALQFITMAVIPAFVEELLFRGLVLSNLLPHGKSLAVVASGVLFGVMHQNFSQLLYATVAGIALGYIYVASRSIWPCVLLHFCNNGLAVLFGSLSARLPLETAMLIYTVVELVILTVGAACAVGLIAEGIGRRRAAAALAGEESEPASPCRIAALFAPAMIAFVIVSLAQAVVSVILNALL
jgi:membrane protease YdiL (CAAX protease family)